jgi:hypothetical protein
MTEKAAAPITKAKGNLAANLARAHPDGVIAVFIFTSRWQTQ